ncbi:D-3-phosphoglycerate dehydrogenase, chloroplastic [Hordeum vulgare]|nr:D-3-phosphoglycerate dehydrogenase, chloroplastic [Hordeum vulgare]
MVGRGSARSTSPLPAPRTACLRGLSPRGPSVASSADLPGSPDPVSSPRILLRGECSTAASAGPSEALWPLLLDDHTRVSQLGATPSAPAVTELQPVHRIKSIVVAPSPGESVTISGKDPGWIEVSHRGGRRASAEPPVPFKLPGAHRPDRRQAFNAVRRGSIRVDGACFNIASWHEHDHATFDSLLLHVRVVIEKVPMQFWSVEGAEEILGNRVRVDRLDSRTLERGHTKTFACWVWTNDVANIPTTHTLGVLPRGAGRVEEMEGFSPPPIDALLHRVQRQTTQ